MPEAMLNFVCWLYIQAVPVLYFFPWFSVTFWEGAQAMKKSIKHAQLDDIQRCGWVDMGPPFMDHYTACFFPIDAGHVGRKIQSHRENTIIFSLWSALCPSALESRPEKNKTKKTASKWRSMIGWNIGLFVLCCVFSGFDFKAEKQIADSIEEIDCVQWFCRWKNIIYIFICIYVYNIYLCIHIYIYIFNAVHTYIDTCKHTCIHTYIWFVTRKNDAFKPSHAPPPQRKRTPTVPVLEKKHRVFKHVFF